MSTRTTRFFSQRHLNLNLTCTALLAIIYASCEIIRSLNAFFIAFLCKKNRRSTLAGYLQLQALPLSYFPWLVAILAGYMVLTQTVKGFYSRRYGWQ